VRAQHLDRIVENGRPVVQDGRLALRQFRVPLGNFPAVAIRYISRELRCMKWRTRAYAWSARGRGTNACLVEGAAVLACVMAWLLVSAIAARPTRLHRREGARRETARAKAVCTARCVAARPSRLLKCSTVRGSLASISS